MLSRLHVDGDYVKWFIRVVNGVHGKIGVDKLRVLILQTLEKHIHGLFSEIISLDLQLFLVNFLLLFIEHACVHSVLGYLLSISQHFEDVWFSVSSIPLVVDPVHFGEFTQSVHGLRMPIVHRIRVDNRLLDFLFLNRFRSWVRDP